MLIINHDKMKKIVLLLILAIIGASDFYVGAKAPLTVEQKAFIVSRFCSEIKYNFVHYDKLKFDWDSLCMASLPKLCATKNDADFIKGLKRLNARLCDGHTYIRTQRGWNEGDDKDREKPFPLTTRLIEGRVIVENVWSKALRKRGIVRGCEIISIDGENVIDYGYRTIEPFVYSSTAQWTRYRVFSGYEITKAPGGRKTRIVFKTTEGEYIEVASSRNKLDWDLYVDEYKGCFEYKLLDGNIGYLKVNNFVQNDFVKKKFDKIYKKILKTDGLIIDIRDNGGGNSYYADWMMSHFCDTLIGKGKWETPQYVAAYASWNRPRKRLVVDGQPIKPVAEKERYLKPMCVLVSERTFSSAENFCLLFRNASRGELIGVATGGSSGNPILMDLGYGVECAICTREEFFSDETPFVGVGIIPDVEVKETVESYRTGRDEALECAVSKILGK